MRNEKTNKVEVTKLPKKLETWCSSDEDKEKWYGRCYEWKRLKKSKKVVAEVQNERNDTENENDSQIMTILSTILENQNNKTNKLIIRETKYKFGKWIAKIAIR